MGEWFLYVAPWSILMSIALFFIMMKVMPPEHKEIEGGKELIKEELDKLGPVSFREWRLIIISVLLLFFWSTEKILHPIDSASITLIALAIMLTPKVGVITWKGVENNTLGNNYSIWSRDFTRECTIKTGADSGR